MSDLVERLRGACWPDGTNNVIRTMDEAADEIERLRATVREWVAANAPGGWIDNMRAELENEQAKEIHSCHADCTRDGCVNRRLRAELAQMQTTLALTDEHNKQLFEANEAMKAELADIRDALAGEDYTSLPSDFPTARMARTLRADYCKFREQVIDTCARAEKAEAELAAIAAATPGARYMDPPDGGSVTLAEQVARMAKDADELAAIKGQIADPSWVCLEGMSASELAAFDYGNKCCMDALRRILDGEDKGVGTCNEPWESLRRRVLALPVADKDAERYRWLRTKVGVFNDGYYGVWLPCGNSKILEKDWAVTDAAIDAAMAKGE